MNERTIAIAERALIDFIRKSQRERDYFKGRLIKADDLPAPNQHMVSAAMRKLEWYKVELMELEGELEMLREELGDLLFAVVNLARHLKVDPENALMLANRKFEKRFRHMEEAVIGEGQRLSSLDLDALESRWQDAKKKD